MDISIQPDERVLKYDYGQLREALIGYLADLDMRINDIMISKNNDGGVPVFCQGLDAGYYMRKKYAYNDNQDLYMKTPRVVVKFDDLVDNKDMNASQDIKCRYVFKNKSYEAFFRRKTKVMTVTNHFVANNYIRALEYYELIESLMRKISPYTYEFLGNTQFGAYELMSSIIQNPTLDASSQSKDFMVISTLELQINLWSINYSSIREIDVLKGVNEGDGFGGDVGKTEKDSNKWKWRINSKSPDGTEHISDMETPHNPNCLGCKECKISD